MGLSVLRLRVGRCLTWARRHLAPFLLGWNNEWDAQKLMISYWSFFADPQFKEEICGRSCHHCINTFCRPQNSKLKMGDQEPLHMTTDGQEDSQTEFDIPIGWSSLFCFPRVHHFSSHWSPTLTRSWQATLGMRGRWYVLTSSRSTLLERTSSKWNNRSLVRWINIGLPHLSCVCPVPTCLLNASLMILGES